MTTKNIVGWLNAGRHIATLAIAAGILPGMANATTTLSLDPATQSVGTGSSFDLALNISGLGGGISPSLSTFDLNVNFDPSLVQFDSFTFGSSLGGLAYFGAGVDGSGVANLFAGSIEDTSVLDSSQPDDFTLGTLHFTALAPGNGTFSLSGIILGGADPDATPILPDSVQGADVTITGTQPVPDGGPGMMAALGVGALMLAHEKMRRQAVSS